MAQPQESVAGSETRESDASTRERVRTFLGSDFVRSLPYWFVPFFIMGVAVYGGIIRNILTSLTDYSGYLGKPDYAISKLDVEMYTRAFGDPSVMSAAQNTFVLMVVFTTVSLLLGLFLAIILDRDIRFRETFQTIYLMPMALSFVVTAQFWLWIYDSNGVANGLVGLIGLGPYQWLTNPAIALGSVIFALIWQFSGYCMIVFLAGLQSIPDDQFEAAKMDGASIYKAYYRVIIPQLKSSSVSAAVVLMIFALKAFTFLYTIAGSRYRPPTGTDILPTLMMRTAFKKGQWAYGAAIATILMVMALAIIMPYLYYQHKRGAL